jgi:O-antigen/teichoic acid export membrane protein
MAAASPEARDAVTATWVGELRASLPRGKTYRRYTWAFVGPASALLLSVFTNSLASRALGPAGFGGFAVAVTVLVLLGVAVGFGMPTSLVRFCARLSDSDPSARAPYNAVAWGVVLGSGLVTGAVVLGVDLVVGNRLRAWVPAYAALALVAGALGTALTEMAGAEAQIRLDFKRYSAILQTGAGLRLLGLVLGLLLGGRSMLAALYGYGFGSLAAGLTLSGRSLLGGTRVLYASRGRVLRLARELGAFALPVVGSTFVVAAISYVDTLLIAPVVGAAEVGVYAAGVRLTTIQSTIITGLATIALPLASQAVSDGKQQRFTKRVLVSGGILGLSVTFALVSVSGMVVRAIYGPQFAQSAAVFAVLSAGMLVNFVGNPLSQLLYASGAPRVLLVAHICQLGALAAGLPLVAERWNVLGVATYRGLVNVVIVSAIGVVAVRVGRAHSVGKPGSA